MASSRETKLRIAGSVLLAFGFVDAVLGRCMAEFRHTPATGPATDPCPDHTVLVGALHVHSTYSDGGGDIPTVMEAARTAGVDFVLLTDHNTQKPRRDGWEDRYPAPPFLLIGTEITVEEGAFLLALDMPPEWEPTKHRPPQETIDEVNRHGGLPLISLPFDVKHPWREWEVQGCVGLEVVNLSTVARRHINIPSLLWLLPLYRRGGAPAALRALLTRPDAALERWDRLTGDGRPSVGIGALDAHALMKIGKRKYPIPSYADSLGVVTTHVLLPAGLGDHLPSLRAAIYDALRRGRCYIAYDALGDPRPFRFFADNGTDVAEMGGRLTATNGPVTLIARSRPGTLLRLYHRGRAVAAGRESVSYRATTSGAYRVEVYRYAARLGPIHIDTRPWVFSNPIYIDGLPETDAAPTA
ncbi:MAG: hypothetical protein SFU56_13720 [Capsulimonadales bacterium]|nr:hypothetical protein [Capsulimonadales bacterium]